ncbi:MAG: ankyrin repeat domain-containing protein [Rickettsia conorii subsp. raoultii]|uniref:ankyrin repeat domain-containing protein n=1 Tax=Rickettsia conorii TaxID=781 RepID=UPI003AF05A0A
MMNDYENNLFATLAFGELSEVQALLKKGVNLDEHKNARGETALHHTLFTGYMDRAKLLLEHNASPNIKDNYGFTPLYSSVFDENIKAAELLLKNGADANFGFTPLTSIMQSQTITSIEKQELIEILLQHGAEIIVDNNNPPERVWTFEHLNVNKEIILKSLLTYNKPLTFNNISNNFSTINNVNIDEVRPKAIFELKYSNDIHHKVVNNFLKDAIVNSDNKTGNKNFIDSYNKYKGFLKKNYDEYKYHMDNNPPYFHCPITSLGIFEDPTFTKKIESIAAFFNNDTQSLEYKAFKTLLSLHLSFKITGSDIILKEVTTSKETEEKLNKQPLIGLKLQSKEFMIQLIFLKLN